jgi:DNA invertase Pin-like site-specific DNA recombinase
MRIACEPDNNAENLLLQRLNPTFPTQRKNRIESAEDAGEVVQQHVEVDPEQILPALTQMIEQRAFDTLCKDAARRQFDVVMAWSVDRLGRSLQDLIGFLSDLHKLKIDLFLHQQGLDTTTRQARRCFR